MVHGHMLFLPSVKPRLARTRDSTFTHSHVDKQCAHHTHTLLHTHPGITTVYLLETDPQVVEDRILVEVIQLNKVVHFSVENLKRRMMAWREVT